MGIPHTLFTAQSGEKTGLARFSHKPSLLQMQGVSHEAVIFYREWLTTLQM